MPNIGPLELAIVLVVALLVLGPKRLPEVGRSLGNGIREFKDSLSNEGHHDNHDDVHLDVEDPPEAVTTAAATAPAAPTSDEPRS
ncbi:MAG: sec-independent protein translocase protein TatA [Thermoleophilaceae bacterium]|jgi:sec-independent protein translocase protein TatA|nr:sec-independent protein translocase protein TatA [Thermoleophilaceae bacterium]